MAFAASSLDILYGALNQDLLLGNFLPSRVLLRLPQETREVAVLSLAHSPSFFWQNLQTMKARLDFWCRTAFRPLP